MSSFVAINVRESFVTIETGFATCVGEVGDAVD
jgi:hypothetical protein